MTDDLNEVIPYNEHFSSTMTDIEEKFKYGNCFFEDSFFSKSKHIYFLAIENEKIVGIIKFKTKGEDSLSHPGFKNWICFIEVRKDYRNKGIATVLKEMLFNYCSENNLNVLSSGFTMLGYKYNLKGYIELAKKYNIEYCYCDYIRFPNFNNFEGIDETEYREYYKKYKGDWLDEKIVIINKKK
jgi:GNAT superfamily N-acetyltransferase